MSLKKQEQDWEDLARLDPLWAILSRSKYKYGRWETTKFFESGDIEFDRVMNIASTLDYPKSFKTALDFGCGVGRLTRAMGRYFEKCHGIDISQEMIKKARDFNSNYEHLEFQVNCSPDLSIFQDHYFDMIYTSIVLQHLPNRETIKSYLKEFIRILAISGLLVFQIPSFIRLRNRLQIRRRLYGVLRMLGVNETFLFNKLKLVPIRMLHIKEKEILVFLNDLDIRVLHIEKQISGVGYEDSVYYVTRGK